MNPLEETRQQMRLALIVLSVVIPIGVIGFMLIEGLPLLDAVWLTVITLATVGYGDVFARSDAGKLFTVFLILFGLGTVAYGLQATANFIISPAGRALRERRRMQHRLDRVSDHYILCGEGRVLHEMLRRLVQDTRRMQDLELARRLSRHEDVLQRFVGSPRLARPRRWLRGFIQRQFSRRTRPHTLLDRVIVLTRSPSTAQIAHNLGLFVVEGDTDDDEVFHRAGIHRSHAIMIMQEQDTASLLAVMTARTLNPNIEITAAVLDHTLTRKVLRMGADSVIAHYDIVGSFLNNATLRPAVNEFISQLLLEDGSHITAVPVPIISSSPWVGKTLGSIDLIDRFATSIIGLRRIDGGFICRPTRGHSLAAGEVLIAVAPNHLLAELYRASGSTLISIHDPVFRQRSRRDTAPPRPQIIPASGPAATLERHYIICGGSAAARRAITRLDPSRPFVIIVHDEGYAAELSKIGFRVVFGDATHEEVLQEAGVERALALMAAQEDDAGNLLVVVNARSLNKTLLITATAQHDSIIAKLGRAGADRVFTPYQIAAQSILIAATRPAVNDFVQYILFNTEEGIETTELYMQDSSPWIGQRIRELSIEELFHAQVVGLRLASGQYIYVPTDDHQLAAHEVLIVVTPMAQSDALRRAAHSDHTTRPATLRRQPRR